MKLSKTSKMPGHSWSIVARTHCNRGAVLSKKEGSICSSCYACKGRYNFANVKKPRLDNFNEWAECQTIDQHIEWALRLSDAIKKSGDKHFRFFDSGDIVNTIMLRDIFMIAFTLPKVQFWLPTRETGILAEVFDGTVTCPPNLNIRVSLDFIGETSDRYTGLGKEWTKQVTFSTVDSPEDAYQCPATHTDDHTCGSCRACWNKETKVVNYGKH